MLSSRHLSDCMLLRQVHGELNVRAAIRVHTHTAECAECHERLLQMQSVNAAIKAAIKAGSGAKYSTVSLASDCDANSFSKPANVLQFPSHVGHRAIEQDELDHNFDHNSVHNAAALRATLRARMIATRALPHPPSSPAILRRVAFAAVLLLVAALGARLTYSPGMAQRLVSRAVQPVAPGLLPDPALTPGFSREVALSEICSINHDDAVREVPASLEHEVLERYGIRNDATSDYELDYLITPGLGGSEDLRNLWPEPHTTTPWNSYAKDQLERYLHQMVCSRQMTLDQAQREIATNWITAYQKHFHTDSPQARLDVDAGPATAILQLPQSLH